jgi:hypothetical protein
MSAIRVVAGILDHHGVSLVTIQAAIDDGKAGPLAIREQAFDAIWHLAAH